MRHRDLILTLILVPLLAIGAVSLYWLLAARRVQAAFQAWVAARRAAGWQVTAGKEQLGGWPFAAQVGVDGFSISGGGEVLPGGLSWRSEQLVLRLPLGSPGRLLVLPGGRQNLRLFGGPTVTASAQRISAEIAFAALPILGAARARKGVLVTGRKLDIGIAPDSDLLTADSVAIAAMPGLKAANEASGPWLKFEATGIAMAHENVPALGAKIGTFTFTGALIHQLPAGTNWRSRLLAWRNHGGMIALRSLSLIWGPLAAGASGRLSLDRHLQPSGQGTARVVGYAATLDALAGAGRIGSGVATAAKALLTLLARPSPAGGPPEVDVPLTLQNRTLRLGQIPLVRIPEMRWPED